MRSTYRLQLRPDAFTFADAESIVGYLAALGISHAYLSPLLTAMHGSLHGYDVTDPTSVSVGLGGEAGLRALAETAHSHRMGLIADIVPNHVGVAEPRQNPWWWDVLLHGQESSHARFFDIDWHAGRLALPMLNSPDELLTLTIDDSYGEPMLALRELRFPIRPGTMPGTPLEVHDRQAYRLVAWHDEPATYRRFLTVNELAALRQEDPVVFAETHRIIGDLAREGVIDGVRIDHPDGLADPAAYFAHLRELIGLGWIVAEKVLGETEPLDRTWQIDGTTGYEALARISGVFVDPSGASALGALTAPGRSLDELKRDVVSESLQGELARLVRCIQRDSNSACDDEVLRAAIVEVGVATPVGRGDTAPNEGKLARTIAHVEAQSPTLRPALAVLVEALARGGETLSRFGQFCVSIGAKAVEDRFLYQEARLICLNEVGCDPATFGFSPAELHLHNADRAKFWPRSMTTLSTHDTKRGEDVRARIAVLSQVPGLWADAVTRFEELAPSPDRAIGLFLWQNLFGIWPVNGTPEADRVHKFVEKAIRENATRTMWSAVDHEFEALMHEWLDNVLEGPAGNLMRDLVGGLAGHGWTNSLGQKVLQLCGPGVPDVYQGSEMWDDSLVDPDNRRLVDYELRHTILGGLDGPPPIDATGAAKLWVTSRCLLLRQERPESFVGGGYWPVYADGLAADYIVGFARGTAEPDVIALTTRFSAKLPSWEATSIALPPGKWSDQFTGHEYAGTTSAEQLFAGYPVVLLARH